MITPDQGQGSPTIYWHHMTNRLTVVVPTYNRPQYLPRALDSLYKQILPVNVIVADDGDNPDETRRIVDELMPDATYIHTGKFDHAWPNWKAGAKEAKSEFVAWLQDDDCVRPSYAKRICDAFDQFRDANVWLARGQICLGQEMGLWQCGFGPFVPMDLINGIPYSWAQGTILATTSYFTSWSLAPAFAFRNGASFRIALDAMPDHCDIFIERLMPAFVANGGPFIADPVLAGYWNQHDDHLSTKQHKDQPTQTKRMVERLDYLIDGFEKEWEDALYEWASINVTQHVCGWVNQCQVTMKDGGKSKYCSKIRKTLIRSLENRVELVSGARNRWQQAVHWTANKMLGGINWTATRLVGG